MKLLKNPIVEHVVKHIAAYVALAIVVALGGVALTFSKTILSWLGESLEVNRWLLVIPWMLFVVLLIAVLVFAVLAFLGYRRQAAAPFRQYTEDVFFGIRWRWEWSKQGAIENLTHYCLSCDRVIPYSYVE